MRRASRRAIVAVVAVLVLLVSAGVAFAGTITSPTGNPFVVPGDASGNPVAFTITATGFTAGTPVNVEQCDGVAPTDPTWNVTTNCDNGASPSPVIADGSGTAVFTAGGSHSFTAFKGESPSSLFNCLSPLQPLLAPTNGLADFRNCKIRVSSNNSQPTGDQAFLNIQLPEAVSGTTSTSTSTTTTTIPQSGGGAGSCTGGKLLGKMAGTDPANAGLTDQSRRVTISASLLTDLATKTKIGGTCSGLVAATDDPGGAVPTTLHPTAIGLKVSGLGSCASTAPARTADATKANAFALSGKLTIKMQEIDALGKNFATQAYVAIKGYDPASTDVLQFTGIVVKGPSVGATVSGKLYMDPVTKAPTVKPPVGTGYAYDSSTLNHCTDGTANNASVLQAQLGDGTSLAGTAGVSGLSFAYTAATSAAGGSCSGSQLLAKLAGTDVANPGLSDQSHRVTVTASLLSDLATKAKIGGTCSGLVVPTDNAGGAIPATLHPTAIGLKVSGIGSCASSATARTADATKANAFPLNGKLTIKMLETDSQAKAFSAQAYVTVKFDPAQPDVLVFNGIVVKGPSVGATVTGRLYQDPVTKITPPPKPPVGNGYAYDSTTLNRCTDGTANNASVVQAQLGTGNSLAGTTGNTGLAFGFPAAS